MYLICLWTDGAELHYWRVKDHDFGTMKDARSFSATLENGRQLIISPASTHTIIIEEILDEE